MNIIKLKVNNFEIIPEEKSYVIENQVNEFALEFEFDDTWDFQTRYVVFNCDNDEETTYKRPIINNQVIVPSELVNGRTTIQIYAHNVENEEIIKRKPSFKYSFSILNSLSPEGVEETDLPTPTQWEIYISQIEEMCNDLQDQFNDLKEECESKCNDVIDRLNEDEQDIQTNTDNIRTNAENIDKLNTDLLDYSLISETGNKLPMSINPNTYVITLSLKDKNNNTLSTQSVDLPLETMIVSASYENGILTFTLKNGQTLQVPIGDLISGLVSTDTFNQAIQGLSQRITTIENDYLTSTDKTALQEQITANAGNISSLNTEIKNISIGNLTELQRNMLYEKITQNDVTFNHTTIYQGSEGWDNNTISSPFIYMTKGTIITFNNGIKSRITRYNDNKEYISFTGTYTAIGTYTIQNDGYYRIGLASPDNTPLEIKEANTLVSFVGYREKLEKNSSDLLEWQYGSIDDSGKITSAQNRIISSLLQVAKGTIIKPLDIYPASFYKYCIDKYDYEGNYITSVQWNSTTNIIDKDCQIRIRLCYGNSRTITQDDIEIIPRLLYIERTIPEIKSLDNRIYECSAHRGSFNIGIPENTIIAYKFAKEHNFYSIETDVRMTSDHIPVICHDETINRTARNSNGSQISSTINVASSTFEQLDAYDYGIYCGSQYAGTKLLTFDEVMKFAKYYNIKVNIDLKVTANADVDIVYNIVRKYGMQYQVRWTIANVSVANYLLTKNSKLEIALGAWTPTTTDVNNIKTLMDNNPYAIIEADFYTGNITNEIKEAVQNNDIILSCYCETNAQVLTALTYGASKFTLNNYLPYELFTRTYDSL